MKCRICNKEKELTKGICKDCLENNNRTFDLNNLPRTIYILNCPNDGIYLGSHNTNRCPLCNQNFNFKCQKCNNPINNPGKICNKCGYNPNLDFQFKCIECGNKLKSALETCDKCGYNPHKDFNFKCKKCGKDIENNLSTCKYCGFNNQTGFNFVCKKCGNKLKASGKTCDKCGYNPHKDFNFKCKKCGNRLNNPGQNCKACGYNPHKDFQFKCVKCSNPINNQFSECQKCHYKPDNIFKSNFITKDSVVYYKGTEIHELIRQLDSGEREIPVGFEKRLGIWTYNRAGLLTGEKVLFNNSNFTSRDNVLFVIDHRTNEYVEWNRLKIDYEKNINLIEDSDIFHRIKSVYPNAIVVPTYITNIDPNNPDAPYMEGLGLFQQRLLELGIEWNAYCKFGLYNNSLIPLVAGKSGSLMVNSSGHDLSFSVNLNHGPARRYINEHNLNWYEKAIIIIPAENEHDSLLIEQSLFSLGFPFKS